MRIIGRLDIKGANVIKGIQFECLRVMGLPLEIAENYYLQGADEIIYIDTVASLYERSMIIDIVRKTSSKIHIPLIAGGGVRKIKDIQNLLNAGADKVAINTAAIKNPSLLSEAAKKFGSQCIVSSIQASVTPLCALLATGTLRRSESSSTKTITISSSVTKRLSTWSTQFYA